MNEKKVLTQFQVARGVAKLRILEADLEKLNEILLSRQVLWREIERLKKEDALLREQANELGGRAGYIVDEIDALPEQVRMETVIPKEELSYIRTSHLEWLISD